MATTAFCKHTEPLSIACESCVNDLRTQLADAQREIEIREEALLDPLSFQTGQYAKVMAEARQRVEARERELTEAIRVYRLEGEALRAQRELEVAEIDRAWDYATCVTGAARPIGNLRLTIMADAARSIADGQAAKDRETVRLALEWWRGPVGATLEEIRERRQRYQALSDNLVAREKEERNDAIT